MSRIGFSVTGLDEVRKSFNNLSGFQKKVIRTEFEEAIRETSYLMRRDAPVDQGRPGIKNSIKYRMIDDLNGEIYNEVPYAPFMEFGTRRRISIPSKVSDYAAQFRGRNYNTGKNVIVLIEEWVRRKGIAATYSVRTQKRTKRTKSENRTERQLAFLIWRKIKTEGVDAQPYFFSDKTGNPVRFEQATKLILDRLGRGIRLLLK